MQLKEIDGSSAAKQRVMGLRANADAARNRTKQLKTQADASAEQLHLRKSRKTLTQRQKSAAASTIEAHSNPSLAERETRENAYASIATNILNRLDGPSP